MQHAYGLGPGTRVLSSFAQSPFAFSLPLGFRTDKSYHRREARLSHRTWMGIPLPGKHCWQSPALICRQLHVRSALGFELRPPDRRRHDDRGPRSCGAAGLTAPKLLALRERMEGSPVDLFDVSRRDGAPHGSVLVNISLRFLKHGSSAVICGSHVSRRCFTLSATRSA